MDHVDVTMMDSQQEPHAEHLQLLGQIEISLLFNAQCLSDAQPRPSA
ncbi:MAG TPA: hypothetical protein VEY92_07280 [Pseudoxanthomonas sp.]|nr:hypothetical protein [Pseudoxanthomonas sp.]